MSRPRFFGYRLDFLRMPDRIASPKSYGLYSVWACSYWPLSGANFHQLQVGRSIRGHHGEIKVILWVELWISQEGSVAGRFGVLVHRRNEPFNHMLLYFCLFLRKWKRLEGSNYFPVNPHLSLKVPACSSWFRHYLAPS